jgi:hypothetical protein
VADKGNKGIHISFVNWLYSCQFFSSTRRFQLLVATTEPASVKVALDTAEGFFYLLYPVHASCTCMPNPSYATNHHPGMQQ